MNKKSRPPSETRTPAAGAQPWKTTPQPPKPGVGAPRPTIQQKPRPQAPPVYRPQDTPKVLQRKLAAAQQPVAHKPTPAAPPVYRPQSLPKVLQTKTSPLSRQQKQAARSPAAPPVYRPEATPGVLQKKTPAAPPPMQHLVPAKPPTHPQSGLDALSAHRGGRAALPAQHLYRTTGGAVQRTVTPTQVVRPSGSPMRGGVIQCGRLSDNDLSAVIMKIKRHIKKMVQDAYAGLDLQPSEMDEIAKNLTISGQPKSRNCAAVVALDDDEMLVGWNTNRVKVTSDYFGGITPTQEHFEAPWNYTGVNVTNVNSTDKDMNKHAEMKIVDYLCTNEPHTQYGNIGITQACCMLCAAVMVTLGYHKATQGYHTKNVTNWVCPNVVKTSNNHLQTFLGPDGWAAVSGDNEKRDQVLLRLSQSHNGWDDIHV